MKQRKNAAAIVLKNVVQYLEVLEISPDPAIGRAAKALRAKLKSQPDGATASRRPVIKRDAPPPRVEERECRLSFGELVWLCDVCPADEKPAIHAA